MTGSHRTGRPRPAPTAPVFIVGEARSGSTLLYRYLQQQPAFGPDPVHLAESGILEKALGGSDLRSETWNLRNFLCLDDDAWQRFLATTRTERRRLRIARRLRLPLHRPKVATLVGADVVVGAYLAVAETARGVTRLVEKSPHQVGWSEHLLRWFPDATLVYITRPPVEVLASYRRRGKTDPRAAAWADFGADELFARYEHRARLALGARDRHPDRFTIIRYHELVADTAAVVETICRRAGAPFEPDAVAAVAPQDYPVPDPLIWDDATRTSTRWEDHVTAAEADELTRRLHPVLVRLGHLDGA